MNALLWDPVRLEETRTACIRFHIIPQIIESKVKKMKEKSQFFSGVLSRLFHEWNHEG
jgi:hypothetical protein